MGDHGHHDPGGHELEAINTKLLFRLLISLSIVTFLAGVAVVQWFYSQRAELEGRYAAEGSFQLMDYKAAMSTDLEGIDRVAQDIVANPDMLRAPPAPAGWIHPDDLVGGGAAAPADAPAEPADAPAPTEDEREVEPTESTEPAAGEGEGSDSPAMQPEQELAPAPEPDEELGEDDNDNDNDKPVKPAKQDEPEPAKPAEPAEPADQG